MFRWTFGANTATPDATTAAAVTAAVARLIVVTTPEAVGLSMLGVPLAVNGPADASSVSRLMRPKPTQPGCDSISPAPPSVPASSWLDTPTSSPDVTASSPA